MKSYKKVRVEAVNAPSGSYTAGCPSNDRGNDYPDGNGNLHGCMNCERTR